jgi:hypothetical protein
MGKKRRVPSPADALFSATQRSVLGLFFGQPQRSFYASEVIGLVGAGSGAVQREIARLEQSGLVSSRHVGAQKHYQANPGSPLFTELCLIAQKTVGLADPVRTALAPLASKIQLAFVYGSATDSHMDLLVVSKSLSGAAVAAALKAVNAKFGRTLAPTVYTPAQLAQRIERDSSFVSLVLERPKIWIFASGPLSG